MKRIVVLLAALRVCRPCFRNRPRPPQKKPRSTCCSSSPTNSGSTPWAAGNQWSRLPISTGWRPKAYTSSGRVHRLPRVLSGPNDDPHRPWDGGQQEFSVTSISATGTAEAHHLRPGAAAPPATTASTTANPTVRTSTPWNTRIRCVGSTARVLPVARPMIPRVGPCKPTRRPMCRPASFSPVNCWPTCTTSPIGPTRSIRLTARPRRKCNKRLVTGVWKFRPNTR